MFLFIDKPKGWTSHDVVAYIRKQEQKKSGTRLKVGHAGTLDPFATGLLIVGVGRESTKRLDEFKNMDKTYVATAHLGATSDTYDSTGIITPTKNLSELQNITLKKITETLERFKGQQLQLPPMYSAKKVQGKKLYELARKGLEIKRTPHKIAVHDIKIIDSMLPEKLTLEITCSSGTYIRSLVHDIGQTLEIGAYCEELRRTKIGSYKPQIQSLESRL